MSRLHDRRAGRRPRRSAVVRIAVPCAAVILLAVLVGWPVALLPSNDRPSADASGSGDRIKGPGATLAVYRRTGAGSERLIDGVQGKTGDVLRIGYRVADAAYGVIASVDGRGVVTLHLPPDEGRAARLSPGEAVLLDHAYELDDAPRWERFYLVTGSTPFDVAPVMSAVRAAARLSDTPPPLALPPALEQTTFVIHKD